MDNENNKSKQMAETIIENGIKNKLSEIYGVEATVYFPNKYCGTADLIGIYSGKETLIDFKQANKIKREEFVDGIGAIPGIKEEHWCKSYIIKEVNELKQKAFAKAS